MEPLHPATESLYIKVLLPLALPKPYTYLVTPDLCGGVREGARVEVEFGPKKRYSAIVLEVGSEKPEGYSPKPILSIIDEVPIALPGQLRFWQWLASYYCCTLGEVMVAALPSHFKLASETIVTLGPLYEEGHPGLDDKEYLITEALSIQQELTLQNIQDILQQRTILPLVRKMLDKKIITLKEDLKEKYKPKMVVCVRMQEPYASNPSLLQDAFEKLGRADRQIEALMAYIQLSRQHHFVRREDLYKAARIDTTVLKALIKKEILEVYEREVSRLGSYEEATTEVPELSVQQERALRELKEIFKSKDIALLNGVTGSGKTRVYMELIREAIQRNEQILYLLPEIALTTQIIERLKKIFGNDVAVYHSRFNNNERIEIWQQVMQGKPLVLGARSALFLPFKRLKWIIVDEEHDPSFKQQDPNPRYHGRDAAIYLASLCGAKVLLGSATPSLESYFNAKRGKYGLVEMPERFGGLKMPALQLVDMKTELQHNRLSGHFSQPLLEALRQTLDRGEQAILFQNRRGFAPAYRCETCGWHAGCIHCDVSMTYHQKNQLLKCHYCNYQARLPQSCPACGSMKLTLKGFGTEKVEEELKVHFPETSIARMDFDTVRTRNAHAQIIQDFEEGRTQILIGTQMVTKGLDFERVGLVGILSADQLLQFPDFRATERAFQMMTQVSGRAGRKHRQGLVLIQAMDISNPVIREVLANDYLAFYQRESEERTRFQYPPYFRLLRITLKHAQPDLVNAAAEKMLERLHPRFGSRLQGPALPPVARVRGLYLLDFLLKLERDHPRLADAKTLILQASAELNAQPGMSGVRVAVDVDPG